MNKILIFMLVSCVLLVFSNIPVKSSEILTPANEHTYEWHLWRWNEFINIDENGNADGFILIEFEFLEENSTQDIDFEIEIPAYNDTLELFSANDSVVSFNQVGCKEGVDLKIFFEKSTTKTYRFFEVAMRYKIKKDLILKQTSEWFENFIRYRFSYIVHINDIFLPSYKKEKSPIINIYLSFPEYSSYSNPYNFSYFSRERLPHLSSIEGRNQSGYAICSTPIPDIKINRLNSVYLRYRGGSSPGEIIFDYSYTNYVIVIVTFAAIGFGLSSSILGIISFFRKRCYYIPNTKEKNLSHNLRSIGHKEVVESKKTKVPNNINKLDSLLLAIPSLFGILGLILPLFANAIIGNTDNSPFIHEILYYFTLPMIFFAILMPLYIGYWRGILILESITERIRGWIYISLGVIMYIIPISLISISTIALILFPQLLPIITLLLTILIIIFLKIILNLYKNFFSFVKRLFKICGIDEISNEDEFIIKRTILSVVGFSIFFYILFISSVLGRSLFLDNIFFIPIRLIGAGPIIYFSINSEKKTELYLTNKKEISIETTKFTDFQLNIISSSCFILFGVFTVLNLFFKNIIFEFAMHMCIGIALFFFLNASMVRLNLKYKQTIDKSKNDNFHILKNINGIGINTIDKLEKSGIRSLKKLNEIDKNEILKIKGIGPKTVDILIKNLDKYIEKK